MFHEGALDFVKVALPATGKRFRTTHIHEIVDVTAEGDRVVLRAIFDGTHTGMLEFKTPMPATGKHVSIEQVFTFRMKDGKIVETWMTMDRLDFQKQLGLYPPPPPKG